MIHRSIAIGLAFGLALFTGSGVVFAGGWAITTVDTVSSEWSAGDTYPVKYTVLQHGQRPVALQNSFIRLVSESTGEELTFPGQPTGEPGQHLAQVSIPSEGLWQWSVSQDFFAEQQLGTIQVDPAGQGAVWNSTTLRAILPLGAVAASLLLTIQILHQRRLRLMTGTTGASFSQRALSD